MITSYAKDPGIAFLAAILNEVHTNELPKSILSLTSFPYSPHPAIRFFASTHPPHEPAPIAKKVLSSISLRSQRSFANRSPFALLSPLRRSELSLPSENIRLFPTASGLRFASCVVGALLKSKEATWNQRRRPQRWKAIPAQKGRRNGNGDSELR